MSTTSERFFKLERAVFLLMLANQHQKEKFIEKLGHVGVLVLANALKDQETGLTVRRHDV